MNCKYNKAWIGWCGEKTVPHSNFCKKHHGIACQVCGQQAITECEATIGSFICGAPLCREHHACKSHSKQRT